MVSVLDGGGSIDLVDGRRQGRVELGVGHRDFEAVEKGARKTGDHVVIFGEAVAGVVESVAAGEGDDSGSAVMMDNRRIVIRNFGDGQFEHHGLSGGQGVQCLLQLLQEGFGGRFVGAFIRTSGSMIGAETVFEDLSADGKLLLDDRGNSGL